MSLISVLKFAALGLVFAMTPWAPFFDRLDTFLVYDKFVQAFVLVAISAIAIAGMAIVPFLASFLLRIILIAILLGGLSIDLLFSAIADGSFDLANAELLWREQAMIGDAVLGYYREGIAAIGWIVPVAVALAWAPRPPFRLGLRWAALPLVALVATTWIVGWTIGGTTEFPAFVSVPAMMVTAATSAKYAGPRESLPPNLNPKPRFRNVVMIVDESVRGDYLGLNDPARATTPFLSSVGRELINFGDSVSIHNCSAGSRLMLRAGLRADQLPDREQRSLKGPVIWQYARKAGYRTVYVDAFGDTFHSYMNPPERGFIDEVVSVGRLPDAERDPAIAEALPDILKGSASNFVYVNKHGVHFPYDAKYPAGVFGEDVLAVAGSDLVDDRDALIRSYDLALRWSVDEFFRRLLGGGIDLSDTLVLYTSDHGQSMLDGGYKLSHCSTSSVVPGEGIVPLFALTTDPQFGESLRSSAGKAFGATTQFNIFPTLLEAMGYDDAWVAGHYGPSLTNVDVNARRAFIIGDVFGISREATWVDVPQQP